MSKTAKLFEPAVMIGDLCIQALAPLAQLFLFKLMAIADVAGGYVRLGNRALTIEGAAEALGMDAADAASYVGAIMEMGWLDQDEVGLFIPSMRQRAEMRAKRQQAGKRGGDATTARRSDVAAVCSSKAPNRPQTQADRAATAKRPSPYKDNNKIIIFGMAVDAFDRGKETNPLWFDGKVAKIYRKEWGALRELTGLSDDYLEKLIDRQDEWLATQDARAQAGWWPLTMHILKRHIGASSTVQ